MLSAKYDKWSAFFSASIPWLSWGIIALGCYFRTKQFLFNRSLWLDEAFLAPSIVNGSFSDFFNSLEYGHFSPPGFLIVSRLFIELFGNNDLTLRLFPFMSGILSLFLFDRVTRIYAWPKGRIIALLLFSVSERLIYYASELKQYSVDVSVTLCLFLLADHLRRKILNISKYNNERYYLIIFNCCTF